jgi:hypothetical protein
VPLHDQNKLRAVDGQKGWKTDPEYFGNYYLGSQDKDRLGDGSTVRLDVGVAKGISHLIASKETPYKDQSEFLRDSALKNLRYQGEHLKDERLLKIIAQVELHAQAIHDEKVMDMNDKFLKVRKKQLENALALPEVQKVYDACSSARSTFEGKQLEELEDVIKECRRRMRVNRD